LIKPEQTADPESTASALPTIDVRWMVAALTCGVGLSALLTLVATFGTRQALALPSFAVQTGQPCANCHIGAFGPQLTPQGRDFKLHGYAATDGNDHGLPFAFTTQTSFTHTDAAKPGGAAPGFKPNDNIAFDSAAVYYAGRIAPDLGAFIKLRYSGEKQEAQVGNIDIRRVGEGQLFGEDLLWGITANNNPTVQDPWNSTPAWGYPYVRSALAAAPAATPLVSGRLGQRVAGAGVYTVWNDLLYWEADVYKGLDSAALKTEGQVPLSGGDRTTTLMPYARLALIRDWQSHHAELGAFVLSGDTVPGQNQTFGVSSHANDLAFDATYQYISDPAKVVSDRLSAHALYIHETSTLGALPVQLVGAQVDHWLDTMRFDVSYSFAATVTPSIQYFRTSGTTDIKYWGTPNGSPGSDGMIFEVAYVPWGKPDSPFPNVNVRLTAQYVSYFSFNGTSANAHANNNFFFGFQTAMQF
jgi:hypothetical protein